MRPLKTIRLIWTFYRNFIFFSLLVTACCMSVFRAYGIGTFVALFWLKASTLGLTCYFINSYKDKEYYYYRNLSMSKTMLWSVTIGFDFLLFLFLLVITHKFR